VHFESEAAQQKEDRARRHREYIEKEGQARQGMRKYNEEPSKPTIVSDATAFQTFLGLRPSTVISRCGQPTEDKAETRSQPIRNTVRTLVYPTQRYGPVVAHFMTLSPAPTVDSLTFSELLIRTTGGSRSLIPAEPNDRKLIIEVLPCLVPVAR
jgi:hypothetical protein